MLYMPLKKIRIKLTYIPHEAMEARLKNFPLLPALKILTKLRYRLTASTSIQINVVNMK